jgi:hypothetical protein
MRVARLSALRTGRLWLNLLEPSGPVKACNGIALPFIIYQVLASGWFARAETCHQLCINGYIQSDQKVSEHLMVTIQKVTSNVQSVPASLQTFIDTPNCSRRPCFHYSTVRVQYSTVRIASVFCNGHILSD